MFLKLAYENHDPRHVNDEIRESVPLFIRVPFTLSTKFIGMRTFGEFSTSKRIIQGADSNVTVAFNGVEHSTNRFYFISDAKNTWDCVKAGCATFFLIPPLITMFSLFNWFILYLIPSILKGKSLKQIEELEKEFDSLSRKFFFGRVVRRKAYGLFQNAKEIGNFRYQLDELSKGMGNNYINLTNIYSTNINVTNINVIRILKNEFHFPQNVVLNQIRLIDKKRSVQPFTHSGDELKMERLGRSLEQYQFICNEDRSHFTSLFFPERILFTDNEFFPVQWFGFNTEVYFLFMCLYYFDVIPFVEMDSIGGKIESNFFDEKGRYLKNLARPRSDFRDVNPQEYAENHTGKYKMIFDLVQILFS